MVFLQVLFFFCLWNLQEMSVRGYLDEINIRVGRLSKADGPLQYRWALSIIQSFEGLNRTERLSKGESFSLLNCLPAWTLIFSCLCICTWTGIYTIESTGSWVFRLRLELPLLALLGLQLANYSSWDFLASIIMWVNHSYKYFYPIYISSVSWKDPD